MGLWSAYFFTKLLLYMRGDMGFDPWLNLAFAAFTALPPGNPRQHFAKNCIAVPVGLLLLYHDAPLPPLSTITPLYIALAVYHSASWGWAIALPLLVMGYEIARRKLRLSTFVFIGILWIAVVPGLRGMGPSSAAEVRPADNHAAVARDTVVSNESLDQRSLKPQALDARLSRFYESQSSQRVRFTPVADDGVPYDILIIQVAALSWDDLEAVQQERDPLLGRFDIVLSHFNSAASYATPAAIRLLRGTCGQTPEQQLYDRPDPECSAIEALKRAGFEPHWLINYDARSDESLGSVRKYGELPEPPETAADAAMTQRTAQGLPVYGDYSVLSRWWARRRSSNAARVVLYYNTVSLSADNRPVQAGRHTPSYGERLALFAADMNRFIDEVQNSRRRAIVIVIAEHGAALRSHRGQMSGIREIPTPDIARVPVGVMLVNAARPPPWTQVRVDASTSYLAVSELLARFIADNPFSKPAVALGPYIASLPQTDFVAENAGITVMQIGRENMMRTPDGSWSRVED